jgi:hypothetical protein
MKLSYIYGAVFLFLIKTIYHEKSSFFISDFYFGVDLYLV